MPSVNDNDLDKLFREAADRNVPEFDPQDWEDMARRLEHEERAATMRSKSLYTLLFLLLVNALSPPWGQIENIQSASIFETQQSPEIGRTLSSGQALNSQNEVSPNKETIADPLVKDEQVKHETIENEDNEAQASIRIINSLRQQREKVSRDIRKNVISKPGLEKIDPEIVKQTFKSPAPIGNPVETEVSNISEASFANRDETNVSSNEGEEFIAPSNEAIESRNGDFTNAADVIKITSLYNLPPNENSVLITNATEADSVNKTAEQAEEDLEHPNTVIKPDQRTPQRWFIKVPISPDFSAIDYADLGDPGINIGLLGEYNVTAHLSISTGAIWSKKLYYSENPDKSYSSGNWTGKASMLDGDCRVLDIPINLTYYIFPDRRTNLFVSLGSSSYIMLKEQYVYTVWANQQEYQYEETFSNENNEWFSMLNLSIGIQQRLGKRFFAQAEPFLKAPMSGVGEGKVNLMSTGIFFSLKYSLTK